MDFGMCDLFFAVKSGQPSKTLRSRGETLFRPRGWMLLGGEVSWSRAVLEGCMVRADQDLHHKFHYFQMIIPSEQVTQVTQKNLYITLLTFLNNVEVFLSS